MSEIASRRIGSGSRMDIAGRERKEKNISSVDFCLMCNTQVREEETISKPEKNNNFLECIGRDLWRETYRVRCVNERPMKCEDDSSNKVPQKQKVANILNPAIA